MNNQVSLFGDTVPFPQTYDDVFDMYYAHIIPPSPDDDAFTSSDKELSLGGKSFFMYGQKVFEFVPGEKPRFRISGETMKKIEPAKSYEEEKWYIFSADQANDTTMRLFISALQETINYIFRHLISETFGCCNDFIRCSDAGHCLHLQDRFYNGCGYRENLEAGRIFYGSNANI